MTIATHVVSANWAGFAPGARLNADVLIHDNLVGGVAAATGATPPTGYVHGYIKASIENGVLVDAAGSQGVSLTSADAALNLTGTLQYTFTHHNVTIDGVAATDVVIPNVTYNAPADGTAVNLVNHVSDALLAAASGLQITALGRQLLAAADQATLQSIVGATGGGTVGPGTVTLADLVSSVQTTLAKADSALQSVPSNSVGSGQITDGSVALADLASSIQTSLSHADTALQTIANNSIGSSQIADGTVALGDLTSAVQTSLGLANTALQTIATGSIGSTQIADGGVALVDLVGSVQTSLGLANTALQSIPTNSVGTAQIADGTIALVDLTTALQASIALAGTAVQPGPVQYYGSGAPTSGLGKNTDTYTDYTGGQKYTKAAGTWSVTTDTTVSKETVIAGAWSTSAGTLSSDGTDGVTSQKLVSAPTGNSIVTYTFTNPVNVVNKMLRMPIRVDSLTDYPNSTTIGISDTVGFTNQSQVTFMTPDLLRGSEVEAFTWCPNTGYIGGTAPDFTAIKYLRIVWTAQGGVARNAYMGQPVVIG